MPFAGLVADSAGNLYGTTTDGGIGPCQGGCGTVFKLTPNSNGSWSQRQLYSFAGGADGSFPETSLVFDQAGNLYGTTIHGGTSDDGTVFRLTSPTSPGSPWTESVLYSFVGERDGEYSLGGLTFDPAGNLYGATSFGGRSGGGTVFQLVAPAAEGTWTLNVLHNFTGGEDGFDPFGALVLDRLGSIYGATYAGTVFKLVPPPSDRNGWTLKVLYRFDTVLGVGALLPGKQGVIYGTSSLGGFANEGTVFRLNPPDMPGQAWTETTLYEFAGGSDGEYPLNGLIADRAGNFYGATQGGGDFDAGTLFRLAPPAEPGGACTKTTLHSFGGGPDGAVPGAGVIFGRHGVLYGTTVNGGSSDNGTVFEAIP